MTESAPKPSQIDQLKAKLREAEDEYCFALASGDMQRLRRAMAVRDVAFAEFNRVFKAQFKKTFKSKYSK